MSPRRTRASPIPPMTPAEIRQWRKRHGMTTADLAEALGVSTRFVNFLETGERSPWYIAALLHWLDCPHKTEAA